MKTLLRICGVRFEFWPDLCLQESLEDCQTAAEFLLEPWILVQLPFQPLLFYQWSVALLAEALTFQKELCEIFYVPKILTSAVSTLQEMCDLMFRAAFKFFNHFTSFMYKSARSLAEDVRSSFLELLPDVLPAGFQKTRFWCEK